MTLNPLPDDALALRAKLEAALHGHTEYSWDTNLTGVWLTEQIWPIVEPLISRLEAAEANLERLQQAHTKSIKTIGQLQRDLLQAQVALCPRFSECGDKQGGGCTCFPDDGPFGNAIPPNTAEARAAAAEAERENLRSALYKILSYDDLDVHDDDSEQMISIARAALTANPKDTEGQQ